LTGLAGRLDVTQGAISKLEHSDDVRVSTLRQYLDALGARLELVVTATGMDIEIGRTGVLGAVNPVHIVHFFAAEPLKAFLALGSIFLRFPGRQHPQDPAGWL
jgi:transcriptional regulator with XRE-family HTH domain